MSGATDADRGFSATVTIDSTGPPRCWNPSAIMPPGCVVCTIRVSFARAIAHHGLGCPEGDDA